MSVADISQSSPTPSKPPTELATWLDQHRAALIARWQQQALTVQLGDSSPAAIYDRLFNAVHDAARGELQPLERFVAFARPLISDPSNGLHFADLIQLTFRLRSAISDILREQVLDHDAALALVQQADPILEQTVLTLAEAYSESTEAELRGQMEQVRLLASQQSLLYTISRALSASLDRTRLMQVLNTQLREALHVADCAILIYNPDGQMVEVASASGGLEHLTSAQLPISALPAPLRQEPPPTQPQLFHPGDHQPHALGSQEALTLALPLWSNERVLGWIVLQQPTPANFGPEELLLAHAIAGHAAVAIENAELYRRMRALNISLQRTVKERTEQLQHERDRLQTLFEIGRQVSRSLDIDELLNQTLELLADLLGVPHGVVMLLEHETDHLVDRAVFGRPNYEPGFVRFQLGEGIGGQAASNRESVISEDVSQDPRWVWMGVEDHDKWLQRSHGSLVGVPLLANDELIGVLMLSHPQTHFFKEDHLLLLNAIANEIAIAIYNAQLYTYLNDRASRLGMMSQRHEEELSKINAILQSLADGVIVYSPEGGVILANLAAERILGRPLDELITLDTTLDGMLSNLKLDEPVEDPIAFVLDDSDEETELTGTLTLGTSILSIVIGPVHSDRGETLGAVLILRDVTREVEADRLKTEFIATVSHELRTPMTSIKGYTQLLSMGSIGPVNDMQQEFLGTIAQNSLRMISIINDLLDVTKIETGSVDLQFEPLPVPQIVGEVVGTTRQIVQQRSHTVALEMQTGLPPMLADNLRIKQILENLISNAIKYTPDGGTITIGAQQVQHASLPSEVKKGLRRRGTWIKISVSDTGVGISTEELEKVFERFYRTENPLKVQAGGTGLGLSIVRGLVHLHGGTIWATSELEKGSTFTFVVPAAG